MAEETLARIYMKVNNPHGKVIPGVGQRNITTLEWGGLPDHVKKSVDASGFFRKPKSAKKSEGAEKPQDESESDEVVSVTDEGIELSTEPAPGAEDEVEEGEE